MKTKASQSTTLVSSHYPRNSEHELTRRNLAEALAILADGAMYCGDYPAGTILFEASRRLVSDHVRNKYPAEEIYQRVSDEATAFRNGTNLASQHASNQQRVWTSRRARTLHRDYGRRN